MLPLLFLATSYCKLLLPGVTTTFLGYALLLVCYKDKQLSLEHDTVSASQDCLAPGS